MRRTSHRDFDGRAFGRRTVLEQICTKIFAKNIHITTDDGSCGVQGTVIALLPQLLDSGKYDCVYVCGPVPMMKL